MDQNPEISPRSPKGLLSRRQFLTGTAVAIGGAVVAERALDKYMGFIDTGLKVVSVFRERGTLNELKELVTDLFTAQTNCRAFVTGFADFPPISDLYPQIPHVHERLKNRFVPPLVDDAILTGTVKRAKALLENKGLLETLRTPTATLSAVEEIYWQTVAEADKGTAEMCKGGLYPNVGDNLREVFDLNRLLACWSERPFPYSPKQKISKTTLSLEDKKRVKEVVKMVIKELPQAADITIGDFGGSLTPSCGTVLIDPRPELYFGDLLDPKSKELGIAYVLVHELGHSFDILDNPRILMPLVGRKQLGELLKLRWRIMVNDFKEFLSGDLKEKPRWAQELVKGQTGLLDMLSFRESMFTHMVPLYRKNYLQDPLTDHYKLLYNRGSLYGSQRSEDVPEALREALDDVVERSNDPLTLRVLDQYESDIINTIKVDFNDETNEEIVAAVVAFYCLKYLQEGKNEDTFIPEEARFSAQYIPWWYSSEVFAETIAAYTCLRASEITPKPANVDQILKEMETWPVIQYYHTLVEILREKGYAYLLDQTIERVRYTQRLPKDIRNKAKIFKNFGKL